MFYHIFYNMETEGILNPDSEINIFALHWSFLPHLQRHLAFFQDAWNNHRIRTAGSQSPLQLLLRYNANNTDDPLQVRSYIILTHTPKSAKCWLFWKDTWSIYTQVYSIHKLRDNFWSVGWNQNTQSKPQPWSNTPTNFFLVFMKTLFILLLSTLQGLKIIHCSKILK